MSDSTTPTPGSPPDSPPEAELAGEVGSLPTADTAAAGLPAQAWTDTARPELHAGHFAASPHEPEPWPALHHDVPLPPGGGQSMLDLALADADAYGRNQHSAATPGQAHADAPRRAETDHDATEGPRSRRRVVLGATATLATIGIALLVVLGHFNAQRLAIRCEPNRIVATAGRSFPPWGESTIDAPEFAAITIPKDTECTPRTTSNRVELEDWYLTALMEQATARLTTRAVTDVELASKQLEQALLLTRSATRRDARKEVDRLVGDVEYWRAAARLKASADDLLTTATQFDAAAKKRPRHVTDAGEWASHVRRVVEVLQAGPHGMSNPPASTIGGIVPLEIPMSPTTPTTTQPPTNDTSPTPAASDATAGSPSPPATGGVLL